MALSEEDCKTAMTHVYKLMGSKKPVGQVDLDDCLANSSPENVKCIVAANDNDAVAKCYSNR